MFRPLTRTQLVVDLVVAGLFAVVAVFLTVVTWPSFVSGSTIVDSRVQFIAAIVLTLVFAAALAGRRWAPGLALGVAWGAAVLQMVLALPPLPANFAIFGILYGAAAYGSRVVFWTGFGSALLGAVAITGYLVLPPLILGGYWSDRLDTYVTLGVTLFFSAALALMLAWTIGALVRTGIRARENRRAQELAEAQTAAEAERTKIARDMHDVVAHSLAVVIAQADGARYAAASDPDAATAALGTISTTARAALSDVRMLLTQLRHTQADGPQPTLADLEQLYAQVRAAGVRLQIDVDPAPRGEVPASVQLAVYRILQEALTNALRHGGGEPVEVRLAWHDERVELTVVNDLAPAPVSTVDGGVPAAGSPARGHGLVGMRERAHLVGGTFEAAPESSPDGAERFVVRGILPWTDAP